MVGARCESTSCSGAYERLLTSTPSQLHIILGRFGCLIVERAGSDVWAFLLSHDILYHHRCVITALCVTSLYLTVPRLPCSRNVIVIKQLIYNDISSTKVRLFVRRGMSIK